MLALIEIGEGSFEEGFPVTLRLGSHGSPLRRIEGNFNLPSAPDIPNLYERWRRYYYLLPQIRTISIPPNQRTQIYSSEQDEENRRNCEEAVIELENFLRINWFPQSNFTTLRTVISHVAQNSNEPQQVVFQTNNTYLQKLPWHVFNLFDDLPELGFALSGGMTWETALDTEFISFNRPVRILAVLGNSEGINVEQDREYLEQLQGADIHFLVEPSRQELNNQLWHQQWDMLYFAGHSYSDSDGRRAEFQINPQDSLSVGRLRAALQRAVRQGLNLAIFNSCNGLGLATQLAELRIPQMIVMRESVPDQVAQAFLREFLRLIAEGSPLDFAIRETCGWLQGHIGYDFPGAHWFPVIIQSPAAPPLVWPQPTQTSPTPAPSPAPTVAENNSITQNPEVSNSAIDPNTSPAQNSEDRKIASNTSTELNDSTQNRESQAGEPTLLDRLLNHSFWQAIGRQLREVKFLFVVGVLIFSVLGIFINFVLDVASTDPVDSSPTLTSLSLQIGDDLSLGEETLVKSKISDAKTAGNQAFLEAALTGDYSNAIYWFTESLKEESNDPETWLYLLNSIAQQKVNESQKENIATPYIIQKVAVAVPVGVPSYSPEDEVSDIAEELLRGVVLAQSEMNCGSVSNIKAIVESNESLNNCKGRDGRFLIFLVGNDQDKPSKGREIAKAIAKQSNILAFIGNNASEVTQQSLEEFQSTELVSISPSNTSIFLTSSNSKNDRLFLAATNDEVAARSLAEFIKNRFRNRGVTATDIAIATDLTNYNPYGESFKNVFLEALSLQYQKQAVIGCDLSKQSVVSDCLQRGQAVQWLLLIPTVEETMQNALKLIENNPRWNLLGSDSTFDQRMLTEQAYKSELVVAVPWGRDEFESDFEIKASELFGVKQGYSWRTLTAYDSTKTIIKSLDELAHNHKPATRSEVYQQLAKPNEFIADGALGPGTIKFDKNRNRVPIEGLGVLVKVEQVVTRTGEVDYEFRRLPSKL
ncbi:CHAT domain-containing protein [Leptolyngbya sp. NK1-12]|uniref:CHAT domain-containing protein n=1 Tax=Leptolyngbya sp. NK1-12 TaxID=2547451 RepID=A0AA96WAZ8_9CYAN|nr:CHAT domain-containing protein [Leptolyngbya sp. NK1-12]